MQASEPGKGKEYTKEDDKGAKAVYIRSKLGTFLGLAYDQQVQQANFFFGSAERLRQTQDGKFLLLASETEVAVWESETRALLLHKVHVLVFYAEFSPDQRYVQILEKLDTNRGKTTLYSLPQMNVAFQFEQDIHSGYFNTVSHPLVRLTKDDKLFARFNNKRIQLHDCATRKIVREIAVGLIEFFEFSAISTAENYLIAVVHLDKKTNTGTLWLYGKADEPTYTKSIKKAEEVKIRFSPTSNQFLMELQTYFDPTGKSYYGQYGLFLFNDTINKITKVEIAKGPVHDFSWHKSGECFLVISGFMPAEPVLYGTNNERIFDFGKTNKNTIVWGNLGRFVCLAGFGNLTGEMDIWDMETRSKMGACKSNSASYCQWAPDDRKLLTAIVTPRLRVDNCLKIFSYTGVQLSKTNFDHTELYEVTWIKDPKSFTNKPRGASPGRKLNIEGPEEKKKFIAFGAAIGVSNPVNKHFPDPRYTVDEPSKLVPGQHPDTIPKKKKPRTRPPKQNANDREDQEAPPN